MGLEIPDEVKWLSWIIGQDWPEGDETAMRRLATAWEDAATGVDELTGDVQGSATKVLSVVQGPAADNFREFWDQFVTTDPQYLPKLSELCRSLAKQCDDGAAEIEYGKYMFIALLIITAIQIAFLIANMIETFGASAAAIPVVEEGAQVVAKSIARKLLEALLKNIALAELQSVGLDVLIQGIQVAEGHRDGFDWSKTGAAAVDGLVNGVIGTGVGLGAGKIPGLSGAATPFKGMVQGAAREAVSGAVSGVAGAVATTAIHGGDLSPEALAKAATSGGFGGGVGGAKGGMDEGAHAAGEHSPSPGDDGFSGSQNESGSTGDSSGGSSGSDEGGGSPGGDSGGSDGGGSSDGATSSGGDGTASDGGSSGDHTASDGGSSGGDGTASDGGSSGGDGGSGGHTSGEPHVLSDNGDASHLASDDGGGSAGSGEGGGDPASSHVTSDGGASSGEPHVTSDGGASSGEPHVTSGDDAPSGDAGGAPHTDGTTAGPADDGTSFNRTNLLGGDEGSGLASTAPQHVPSETPVASHDAGGSSDGHVSSASRIDSLLNGSGGGSSGGGSGHASTSSPHGSTLAEAGPDTATVAPPTGETGRTGDSGAPNGTAPAGPSAGGMPMTPPMSGGAAPMGGGGTSGSDSGGGRPSPSVRSGVGTTSEPRTYQPSTAGDRTGGIPERPGRDMGGDRPGSTGTDRRPGSPPADGRSPESTPSAPSPEERSFSSSSGVPTGLLPETPTLEPHAGEPRPVEEPTAGAQDPTSTENRPPETPPTGTEPRPETQDGRAPTVGTEPRPATEPTGEPRPEAVSQDGRVPTEGTEPRPVTEPTGEPRPEAAPREPTNGTEPTGEPRPEAVSQDGRVPTEGTEPRPVTEPTAGEPRPEAEPRDGRLPTEGTEPRPVTEPAGEPRQEAAPQDGRVSTDGTDPSGRPDPSTPHTGEPHEGTAESHDGAEPRSAEPHDGAEARSVEPHDADGTAPHDGEPHTVGPTGAPVGLHEYAEPGDYHEYAPGIGTNDERAAPLLDGYKPWGELPDQAAFDAEHRPGGNVRWPENEGAAGPARRVTLPAGTVLDRFGYPGGEYLSPLRPDGHPYSYADRAILPDSLAKGYHAYVLDRPVTVDLADVAPAFEQDGGGRQVKLIDEDLKTLLNEGGIHEVAFPPEDGLVLPHDFGVTRPDGTAPEPTTVGETGQHHDTGHPSAPRGHEPTEPYAGHTDDQPHHDAGDGTHHDAHDASHDGTHHDAHVPAELPEGLPQHLHEAYAASEETPAGRSLYTPEQQNMRDLAQRVQSDPNHYVMDGHGNADGMRFGDRTLSARDVADIIRSDPNWNGREVLLVSCETGAHPDSFASQLSHELGVPVTAPDRLAWTDNQGRIYSASSEHGTDGRPSPTWPPDGGWHTYGPDGSAVPSGHDGFPPHHTGEDASHGQDHAHHSASRGDDPPTHEPGDHSGVPGAHHDGESPVHELYPDSPYNRTFDPPMDGPVVHVSADDPRVVPDEPFSHRTDLEPGTRYEVEGRGTFWTDQEGHVRHVDAEIPNTKDGVNPDVRDTLPEARYRVTTEHGSLIFGTDKDGNPPPAALYDPPTHVVSDPGGPPREVPTIRVGEHPDGEGSIPAPRPGEGFGHRTDLDPNTRYEVYDSSGNHVGDYTTDGEGHPRWVDTESGRQFRQHPELGKNYDPGVRYRLSENFDPNDLRAPDAAFDPPPHTGESKITLDGKEGDSLHRRVATNDPFVGRDGLAPNHKYVIEQQWGKRVEPYAVCYTDSEGKVVAVDTFKPFNTDLNNPLPESQYRINHADELGTSRPTVLNTREPVTVTNSENVDRRYVGTHGITHHPDAGRRDNNYRRDGSAQSDVGSVGRDENEGTKYAGGHGARNKEGMMGESSGQMPQKHAENSGLNSDGVTRPESWYQMEEDRAARGAAGATIGPINALGSFMPTEGTPRVMWQVWTESGGGQPLHLFIRSFANVPADAASS